MMPIDITILIILFPILFMQSVMMAVVKGVHRISVLYMIGYGFLALVVGGVYILKLLGFALLPPEPLSILVSIGLGIALSVPLAAELLPKKDELASSSTASASTPAPAEAT
ncbi:MAG TPA: hypothetical protein VL485_07940 [Ktedonobacteraceae bacterium]|jgi:hypothetical protein|nr:hypothetical protein [Ktedonobacteraceae bacterium]